MCGFKLFLQVTIRKGAERKTRKQINVKIAHGWAAWYQIKLVSALKGVLACVTSRVCQFLSHSSNQEKYQAGHLTVSNYRKYNLSPVQRVRVTSGARYKSQPISSSPAWLCQATRHHSQIQSALWCFQKQGNCFIDVNSSFECLQTHCKSSQVPSYTDLVQFFNNRENIFKGEHVSSLLGLLSFIVPITCSNKQQRGAVNYREWI